MSLDLLSSLFGVGGAQAAEAPAAPSGFVPPEGAVPLPPPRPANLGTVPTAPTVQTPESTDPTTAGPFGTVLARLNAARNQNVAGADGSLDAGGGGGGMAAGAAAGMGHSKFGAFANGLMLGMKANSDSKAARAKAAHQELTDWAGIKDKEAGRAETARYHDILGNYYEGQNNRATARGAGGGGGGGMTPAAIELARSRAAKRLGLMEPLPQYATDDQKASHAARRAEAQQRFDQWDSSQPWGGKRGPVAPVPDDAAGDEPAAVTPAPDAAQAATTAAPAAAAPATTTWQRVRNRETGDVMLFNPATKEMKPIGGE